MTRIVLFWIGLVLLAGCERKPQDEPSAPAASADAVSSNADPRQALLARINRNGDINDPATPRPLVTLEEFFEGNNDYGSIGYNFYPDQPGPEEFYRLFKSVRARPEVADVRVQVMDLEDPAGWPSTDTVWIITSASPEDVRGWLGERFRPDDILIGFPTDRPMEPCEVPDGMKALGVWWD